VLFLNKKNIYNQFVLLQHSISISFRQ